MQFNVTKNKKNKESIVVMLKPLIEEKCIHEITEITEGMFNAVYRVNTDDEEYIVKIAPSQSVSVMTVEKDAMQVEIRALDIVNQNGLDLVPQVVYYDQSCINCDAPYFVMKKMPGKTFGSVMDLLSEQQKDSIYLKVGDINRKLNNITNGIFGSLTDESKTSEMWYVVFRGMLTDMLDDCNAKGISIPYEKKQILSLLSNDSCYFDDVKNAHLVHWDLWEHNVMVHEDNISGVFDFERCFWGDYLMEFGFRAEQKIPAFLKGYGKESFSKDEQRRMQWYDLYWYLFNINEGFYRNYADDSLYTWGIEQLVRTWKLLSEVI